MGLPVVATNVGGIPFLIDDGENGLLVPGEDSAAMVKSIKSLLAEPELAEKFSVNGRKLAERSDWTNIRPRWEQLFEKALKQKSTGVAAPKLRKNFSAENFKTNL